MFKKIYIEITNVCNLNCQFCEKTKKEKRIISIDEFSYILNEIKPYTNYIYLHVQGEPLTHPHLEKLLIMAKEKGLNINITTNATLLNKNMYIVKYARQINISIQAIYYLNKKDEYLKSIIEMIRQNINSYIQIRLWGNFQKEINDEIINYFSKELNVKIDISKSTKIIDHVFFSFQEEFDWPSLEMQPLNVCGRCQGTINHIAILSDGTVIPCCLDKDGIIDLGNIFHTPLSDILNSKRYLSIKNGFLNNQVNEDLCIRCTYRQRFIK